MSKLSRLFSILVFDMINWSIVWMSTLSSMIGYAMGMCIGCCFEDVRLAVEIAPVNIT